MYMYMLYVLFKNKLSSEKERENCLKICKNIESYGVAMIIIGNNQIKETTIYNLFLAKIE